MGHTKIVVKMKKLAFERQKAGSRLKAAGLRKLSLPGYRPAKC
jgi:hypothetical protein